MSDFTISRRTFSGGLAGVAALASTRAFAQAANLPKSPIQLSIIDVAGNLALTKPAIEAYAKAKPNLVSKVVYTQATSPELPAKLIAQQQANRVDIDMVLTGTDALSAGI